jgi:hypothetical protein
MDTTGETVGVGEAIREHEMRAPLRILMQSEQCPCVGAVLDEHFIVTTHTASVLTMEALEEHAPHILWLDDAGERTELSFSNFFLHDALPSQAWDSRMEHSDKGCFHTVDCCETVHDVVRAAIDGGVTVLASVGHAAGQNTVRKTPSLRRDNIKTA